MESICLGFIDLIFLSYLLTMIKTPFILPLKLTNNYYAEID